MVSPGNIHTSRGIWIEQVIFGDIYIYIYIYIYCICTCMHAVTVKKKAMNLEETGDLYIEGYRARNEITL